MPPFVNVIFPNKMLSSNQGSVFAVALLPSQLSPEIRRFPRRPLLIDITSKSIRFPHLNQAAIFHPCPSFCNPDLALWVPAKNGCECYCPRWRSFTLQNGQEFTGQRCNQKSYQQGNYSIAFYLGNLCATRRHFGMGVQPFPTHMKDSAPRG